MFFLYLLSEKAAACNEIVAGNLRGFGFAGARVTVFPSSNGGSLAVDLS